jgi:outer membrane protein OmpA-like peptidoglycan-associated protein
MPPVRPMLGDIELQLVQKIEVDGDQVLVQHSVPALEGDFLQRLNRRATQVTLSGVLTGPEAKDGLKTLREKFRAAEPVPFVADITTANRVDQVLIEEMGVRELAGKPERFEYAFTLREYIPPPAVTQETPPELEVPESHDNDIDENVGTLIVAVEVEGHPNFDHNKTIVTIDGMQDSGTNLSRTLMSHANNIWMEEKFPSGKYTAKVVACNPQSMSGSAPIEVQAGQTTQTTITLHPGIIIAKSFIVHFRFDKAFIEPCMRGVLRQVSKYAMDHPNEKVVIIGHTDKVGDDAQILPLYNQSLSERRARSTFAFIAFGRDEANSRAEWDQLRRKRTAGARLSINDTWDAYEYQFMLQDLGFYRGNIDGIHETLTDNAVAAFRCKMGLPPGNKMDDPTWEALIREYLKQDNLQVPIGQFLLNAKNDCNGGILKWLGCGEELPNPKWGKPSRPTAWRPYRRVELLFVETTTLPCDVPRPDTFDLPPGIGGGVWCLGPNEAKPPHCCLVTYEEPKPEEKNKRWFVQPAEPKIITAQGKIRFENFPPQTKIQFKYVLTSPDGEYIYGEQSRGEPQSQSVSGITDDQGVFEHIFSHEVKPEGIYTLEIRGKFVVRRTDEPPSAATRNIVCKRLNDIDPNFDVIVIERPPLVVNPIITLATSIVVVKKPYINPKRQLVTLSVDYPFCHGNGVFTRSNDNINFFTDPKDGIEITFDGNDNVFSGSQLMSGVMLYAEGAKHSAAMDDVELVLALTATSPSAGAPVGPPATTTMTAVELTLDICAKRTSSGVDPTPLSSDEKIDPGRLLGVKTPGNRQERAMLIVHPAEPAGFSGELELSTINDHVQAFKEEVPAEGQVPCPNPYIIPKNTIPADGLRLWAQGAVVSKDARDTGFLLGIKDVEKEGDKVVITVIPCLYIRLIDDLDRSIPNASYRLEVDGQHFAGTSDRDGVIVEYIPINASKGRLFLNDKLFHRRDPQTGEVIVDIWSIELQIAELALPDKASGAQARLNNLGLFASSQINDTLDDQTKRAWKRFQSLYNLPITESLDPQTQEELKKKYGS